MFQIGPDGVERLIAYTSRKLSKAESSYSITDLECLGIVFACRQFCKYMLPSEMNIITDHIALKSLVSAKELKGRLLQFTMELGEFDLRIVYQPRELHYLLDLLSQH